MENMYGNKIWWVCATDIEWIEVELAPKPHHILDQKHAIQNLKKKWMSWEIDVIHIQSRKNNSHSVH